MHSPYLGAKIVLIIFVVFRVISNMVMLFLQHSTGIFETNLITGNRIMFKTFHVR